MTFDDDFIQINFAQGEPRRAFCVKNGMDWPPPEEISFGGFKFKRVRYSLITDEQRAQMTNVCRGAEYVPSGE